MIAALGYCARNALRSRKSAGRAVGILLCALIPPVIGNSIIIISGNKLVSTVGYYIYFLGMNCVMAALIHFADEYCAIRPEHKKYKIPAIVFLAVDTVQLLCNPIFHHAFDTEAIEAGGFTYYRLLPLLGQTFHRVVDYGLLAVVIILFFVKMYYAPRIYSERYSVILISMIVTAGWETFYIFSRTPIDRSMIGFGAFGFMVYFFSIKYRPMRLLDRMLSHIASTMPEALYFFDASDTCIWANQAGIDLVGIENEDYEVASTRLRKMFGNYQTPGSQQHEIKVNGETRSFVVENHDTLDERGRLTSSFLSVRDNTAEQMTLRAEIYKATHDPLTDVYNRAGYNLLLNKMELWKTIMLLIDTDCFKKINDTYGHETGDNVLKKVAATLTRCFRSEDYVCRIGGDEFVVLMLHSDSDQRDLIISRVQKINSILSAGEDGLPPVTVSVGAADGRNTSYPEQLFEHADRALYETKRGGKNGYTFYEDLPQ